MQFQAKAFLWLLVTVWPLPLSADSWASPTTKDYYSADSSHFVRVVPLFTPEKYEQWRWAKPKQKGRFSPKDTLVVPCHAMLFQRTKNGPRLIWKENLINRVAPVSAIVSNDGRYMVTFDNWYSIGYGIEAMVIHNNQGHMLKRYSLEQISPFPINQYSRSISSMYWRCDAKFVTPEQLAICFEAQDNRRQTRVFSLVKLDFE